MASPFTGKVMPGAEGGDGVFSEKMVGDGFAVEPEDDKVYAPADGTITMVFDTKHAFTLMTDGGLDVLVHMGIDTIQLQGKPFLLTIREGDKVRRGDLIGTMDRKAIQDAGYRTITPVVVGNVDDFDTCQLLTQGQVEHGTDVLDVH